MPAGTRGGGQCGRRSGRKKDRGDASVLGRRRGRAETRKNEWGWVRRCGRKQKEGGADPQRVEKWKPRRAVVGWSPRKDR